MLLNNLAIDFKQTWTESAEEDILFIIAKQKKKS